MLAGKLILPVGLEGAAAVAVEGPATAAAYVEQRWRLGSASGATELLGKHTFAVCTTVLSLCVTSPVSGVAPARTGLFRPLASPVGPPVVAGGASMLALAF